MNGERDHEVNSVEERVSLTRGSLGQAGGDCHTVNGRHQDPVAHQGTVQFGSDGFVVDSRKSVVVRETPVSVPRQEMAAPYTGLNGSSSSGTKETPTAEEDVTCARKCRLGYQAAQRKVNIYETEELLRHPAYRYYTAGGVSVVVHPESGVHDGT